MASLTTTNSDNQWDIKGKTLADFGGDIDAFKKYPVNKFNTLSIHNLISK